MTKRYQVIRQSGHQQEAKDDAECRRNGPAWDDETATAFGLTIAQHDDADGDEHEGEESADVGKVGEGADVEEA